MKSTFTFLVAVLFSMSVFSQTANSINNGNFLMPTTWDCTCVPGAGYNINISHTVTMTTSWMQTGGTITVNSGGTLTQDASNRTIAFNGGLLVNNGTVTFSKMAVLTGPLTNSGTLNANDSLFINAAATNTGTINSANYLNGADLTNSGNVSVTNLFNDGTINNSWNLTAINFFNNNSTTNSGQINFSNCTNAGMLTNDQSINGTNDFTNAGILNNNVNGNIQIDNNCTNGDSISNDAHWLNNGATLILNDFTNVDLLEGYFPGHFCVANNSANFGTVLGDFDFCDQLTVNFGLNSGTISNSITYCQFVCWESINENNITKLEIFPNPVKESLTIQFNGIVSESLVQIVNSCGQIVFQKEIYGIDELTINRNNLSSGLYILKVSDDENVSTRKIVFN